MPRDKGYKDHNSGGHSSKGVSTGPGMKVVPISKTKASQNGSMGSGSKTGNATTRKKPPSSIGGMKGK